MLLIPIVLFTKWFANGLMNMFLMAKQNQALYPVMVMGRFVLGREEKFL